MRPSRCDHRCATLRALAADVAGQVVAAGLAMTGRDGRGRAVEDDRNNPGRQEQAETLKLGDSGQSLPIDDDGDEGDDVTDNRNPPQ